VIVYITDRRYCSVAHGDLACSFLLRRPLWAAIAAVTARPSERKTPIGHWVEFNVGNGKTRAVRLCKTCCKVVKGDNGPMVSSGGRIITPAS
jgi:hypothetical protein